MCIMSLRHIDFIKIKPSKILMVEVRPLRCSIATSYGMKKTAKWMSYEHWKELHVLLSDVTTLYQESKLMGSTQEIKCYERKMMYGNLIKIGYMFVAQNSYMCCHLIPRDDATWTDDDDEGGTSHKDKDGKCEVLIPCGERLVVSVQLQSQQSLLQNDKQLSKALDCCFAVINTLSDSIPSSQENYLDSETSLLLHSSDEQEDLIGMIDKSHSRCKQLAPKIHESNSDLDHDETRSRRSIFDTSEKSTDHNAELVMRQLDLDVNNLFKDIVNGYPTQTEKCIQDNSNSEEEMLFIREEINERDEDSEIQEMLFIKEEIKSEVVEDTEIPPLSDELQSVCDKSQLLLGDCLFDRERRNYNISKDEEKCIDYDTLEIVKTEEIEIFNNPIETELVPDHNSNVKYEVPPSYAPESRQVLLAYDVEEIGKSPGEGTSISHNEEPVIRTSLQHCERNAFEHDESLTEKHCVLSLEKNSSKSSGNPVIESRKSELCETADYSLTDSTQPSMKNSNPETIKERSASDEDSSQKNDSRIFMPNNSFPQLDNNDVGQPIVVSDPLECRHDKTLSPIRIKAKLRGRKRKKNKFQHLFGKDEGSIIEKRKPEESFIKEDSALNSGEYVPTVKKSLPAKNITENMLSSHPEYTPSPIDREQATKQWKRKDSSKQKYSKDPDYKSFFNKTFVENEGEASFRRSKRLQCRDTKGLYTCDISFFNEEMDEIDDQNIILNQDVKEHEKREIKIVDQEKYVGSLESSECISIEPQKVIRGCKRPHKRKQPCSNLKCLKGDKDNQEHSFESKNKFSHESTIGNIKSMSVNDSERTVVKSKDSQEISGIKGRGKRKQGIVESEKTREGKIVLHEVMREIEEAQKRRLEDHPLPGYISGTQLLNDNRETENVSKVINKRKPAKCKKVEKISKLTKTNSSKKLMFTASVKNECMDKSNKNIDSEKEVACKKIQKTAKSCKPLGRKKFQEHKKSRNKSYAKRPSIDMLGESSKVDTSYNRKSKEDESQSMKLCGDLSFSNKDWGRENVDKIPVQDENITSLNISHPPLTSLDDDENLKTNPMIDHLRKCKTKLTGIPSSELSDRLEYAHEYLNGIMYEKIHNEKHEIFKEHGKAWADMLSVEVYAVFREDQSEYMIDLMRKKYYRNLQFLIKNEYSRRQYIWKVLVPCFFIKLTMDILDIENEKEAQDTLTQISMNFAD